MFDPQVNRLIDFLYGKESQADDIGAVARFVRAHVMMRPALADQSRWPDIVSLKTHALHAGPNVTASQIDAALAAAGLS